MTTTTTTATMMRLLSRAVVLMALVVVQRTFAMPTEFVDQTEIPSTGEAWIPMNGGAGTAGTAASPGSGFQPAATTATEALLDAHEANIVREAQRRFLGYDKEFADGTETYYDDYAQAWRLIGMYIDCNVEETEQEADDRRRHRHLEEEDDAACERYLLWAAYVDVGYSGGGTGEYKFWDRDEHSWTNNTCIAENGRCEKMDCHLPDTNFKLLGYFKEPNWAQWMEQLFKHEGICIWKEEEYMFMQTYRQSWPEGCSATSVTAADGNYLYYDTKPLAYGGMGLGLYTDSRCSIDYTGDEYDAAAVLSNQGLALVNYLNAWNSALDIYKTCQPCKAYNIGAYDGSYSYNGNDGGNYDDDNDYSSAPFPCYDDAGYTNVNQCMKFATHTTMTTADFQDLILASGQGTITQVTMGNRVMGSNYFGTQSIKAEDWVQPGWIFLGVACLAFFVGACMLLRSFRQSRYAPALREPLVASNGVAA